MQPVIAWFGPVHAYAVYKKAAKHCPAYKTFLAEYKPKLLKFGQSFATIPETNKENYVKKHSVESRCYNGAIPTHGVVIDESSGSSGTPNNWVRGLKDRNEVKKLLQFSLALTYHRQNIFFINCFALGPWATGMNVSMSVADVAILKSIGPDEKKLENTLRDFGTDYKYVVVGYPPFIKMFVNNTSLDLTKYKLHLITGGEAMSFGLRKYLSQYFNSIISSYGASDLDINIGFETEYTHALGKACHENPAIAKELFGRDQAPMIFQYNPQDYYIELSDNNELIFTICRLQSIAPKIRYNIRDNGGVLTTKQITERLKVLGINIPAPKIHFPVLYVFGRADLSVPFYGAKIFTTDMDSILHENIELSDKFYSFQLAVKENDDLEKNLIINLELKPDCQNLTNADLLKGFLFEKLKLINQDFREVSKMFGPDKLIVNIFAYQTGPFKDRNINVKQKYIAS